jgi:hypothetical protein
MVPAAAPPEGPLAGIRAWLSELDDKLSARTRVFLVLAALAIGGAAAAIYLALDARDAATGDSAQESRIEALETRLQRAEAELRDLTGSVGAVSDEAVEAASAARALEDRIDALDPEAADPGVTFDFDEPAGGSRGGDAPSGSPGGGEEPSGSPGGGAKGAGPPASGGVGAATGSQNSGQ